MITTYSSHFDRSYVREGSKSIALCGRKDSIEAFQFRPASSLGTELSDGAVGIESRVSISTAFLSSISLAEQRNGQEEY